MAGQLENDLNPNTYIGLSFPLGRDNGRLFSRTKTLKEQARHNLRNLLLTNLGERPGQPEFGTRLLEQVFEFGEQEGIEEAINVAVEKWLPYISINEVVVNSDYRNPNKVNVEIKFSVSTSPESTEAIELDFTSNT